MIAPIALSTQTGTPSFDTLCAICAGYAFATAALGAFGIDAPVGLGAVCEGLAGGYVVVELEAAGA